MKHFILVVFDPVLVKGEVWPRKTRYLETKEIQREDIMRMSPTSSLRSDPRESPRVYTVNYLLREMQVKFEVFLTIN